MKPMDDALVYIVVLNWNGWKDTLECLESLFRLEYPRFRVVVCDNGSSDNSVEYIGAWAEGRLCLWREESCPLRDLSRPPVVKPIRYRELSISDVKSEVSLTEKTPLILIRNEENLGFAGGNNVGLRFALADRDTRYVWLLNNDTVVDARALCRLVERMEERPDAGICGSTILFFDRPDIVQSLGGAVYNHRIGSNRHLGLHQNVRQSTVAEIVERQMDYVVGASMLVRRQFLETIGLMDERYFLYFEELDWATRGKGIFRLAYSAASIVYHKEGASAGTSSAKKGKSPLSDFYSIRNRIVFTKKFYPWALPMVYAGIFLAFLNRVRRGQPHHAGVIGRILLAGADAAPPAGQGAPEP